MKKSNNTMNAAGSIFNKKVILIGLLLLANLIGFVVARNYFTRNACMTCAAPREIHKHSGNGVSEGKGTLLNWTFTLIRSLGSGKHIR
ncbi:MAG: hypothetical protein KJS92_00510 [Bacteroidetes bacterium]|nr:hypothetical protein [Bacteroidota bacterium]